MGYMKRLLPILWLFNLVGIDLKPVKLPTRNFLEFLAGDQAVTKGLRLRGFVGDPIDVRLNADHDLLTPCGFLVAVVLIFSVCKGGLVWLAPPCSTWVWMSRSSMADIRHLTGGHLDPLGNRDNPNVERQNMLVWLAPPCSTWVWRRRIAKNDHMLKKHYWKIKNGKKRTYGGSGLKKTQSYLPTFGCYHAKMVPPADPADEPPRLIDLSASDSDDSIPNDDPALADLTKYNPEYFAGPAQLANELRVLFRH
jgi:hypothetical protein